MMRSLAVSGTESLNFSCSGAEGPLGSKGERGLPGPPGYTFFLLGEAEQKGSYF